jgi:aminopeptidase N
MVVALGGAMARADDKAPAEVRQGQGDRRDRHSFGNPDQVRVTHVDLDLAVDFDRKELKGTATLSVERPDGAPKKAPLVLDTRALAIGDVSAGPDDGSLSEVEATLGKDDPILGAPLTVRLPEGAKRVRIAYRTSPGASALQWVQPAGTAGGKLPFLFSQSQAIHARSWIPLQDSPGVRVTYKATIRVAEPFKAAMSAEARGREGEAHRFEMTQPIAPYLIALAVGDLDFRSLGPRTGVWSEPSVVGKAAWEFADTERMIESFERRFGPYRWGRYDILVLPPSFPFGGMENARLTFATPTVLAGDRSLVSLIAHELAHSWSGNLVTNATWRDFWLNEGITTYLERRAVEDLYGPDVAAMEWVLGAAELRAEIAKFAPRDEILHIDLTGRDPDDGMTRVPYEKGALLLARLERQFGRDVFDDFLKGYFDHFAFRSITTADFESYVREHLFPKQAGRVEPVDLHTWIHEPGLPPDAPEFRSERFAKVDAEVRRWLDGQVATRDLSAKGWSTQEWLHFLQALPARIPSACLAELDKSFGLTERGNAEVVHQWLLIAIRAGYAPADARLEQFLTTIGRRKFLLPLYEELAKTPAGKARARAIFAKARPFYHPIAADSVDRLLSRS